METKYDNSHLCGFCTGSGMDGGDEVCKPCKGTGIDPAFWAREIVKLQTENYHLKQKFEIARKTNWVK